MPKRSWRIYSSIYDEKRKLSSPGAQELVGFFSLHPENAFNIGKFARIVHKQSLFASTRRWKRKQTAALEDSSLFGASWKQTIDQLDQSGIRGTAVTYTSLLRTCAKAKALSEGKRIHSHMIKSGLEQGLLMGSLLLQMYGTCRADEDAIIWFANMHHRRVYSWNVIIRIYAQQEHNQEAFRYFDQMQQEGVMPNKVTFICLISSCASQAAFKEGCRLHARTMDSKFESDVIGVTTLVNLYGKCGRVQDAKGAFDNMPERDVALWNSMIAVYAEHEDGNQALHLFSHMQQEGVMPDKVTFIAILAASASQGSLLNGKWTHARIADGSYEADVIVETALVNMYGKCGSLEDAWRMFDNMPERSVVSWTAMIAVLAQQKQSEQVFKVFDKMQWEGVMPNSITFVCVCLACATKGALHQGKSLHVQILESGFTADVVVGNALINMYGKCGSLDDARKMFKRMPLRDVVTWNGIITIYAENGHVKEALQFFEKMRMQGVTPDKVTFISILVGCTSQGDLTEGEQVHAHILNRRLESDVVIGNSLINMYSKCGSLEKAKKIFDRMPNRNVISWTAMIAAFAQHGHGKDALCLFDQMHKEGTLSNEVTFVNIIVACSHAGLIDEGRLFFASMIKDHGISPSLDHYVCMVDLFGRAGQLDEAESFINNMPIEPNAAVFLALLSACRYQVDLHRGEHAARRVFDLDPEDSAPYVILSKMYSSVGRGDAAAKVLSKMWSKGLKEGPDYIFL